MNWLQRLMKDDSPPTPSVEIPSPAAWMQKDLKLPSWAALCETHSHKLGGRITVDMNAAYREWLQLLGAPTELTQYWIECAYQCIKLDLQMAIENSQLDPRTAGKPTEFHFRRAPEFALDNYPVGLKKLVKIGGKEVSLGGAELATRGREARDHYKRIRGRLPL